VYKTRATERDSGLVGRPLYADWQGADAFVSLHTNAAEMPNVGSGISTYIHDTSPTPGSATLQGLIHDELVRTTRATWAPMIRDRGKLSANFAVVREIKTMPAVLLEVLFHDTAEPDARLLRDAGYRRDIARAIYKGVVRYFDPKATITPLAPSITGISQVGDGAVRIRWSGGADPLEPKADATSYQIQVMHGDTGFSTPADVGGPELVMSGLRPGEKVSFQVRGVNAGGAGLPSASQSVVIMPWSSGSDRPLPMMPMDPEPPEVPVEEASGCAVSHQPVQAAPQRGALPFLLLAFLVGPLALVVRGLRLRRRSE
jgi:hypothetical protein